MIAQTPSQKNRNIPIDGSFHIPILKFLFETKPYFEAMDLDNIVK